MASPPKSDQPKPGAGGTPPAPELPAFPGQEEDFLFKAQMTIANTFYGYWKHAIAVIVLGLAAVFFMGTWQNHQRDTRRAVHAQVASVTRTLQKGLEKHAEDPDMVKAQALEGGKRFAAIGQDSSGASAAYAWIKAAQAYSIAEDDAQQLAAWEAAHAAGAKGALGWAAVSGLATARADAGNVDGAVSVLQDWASGRSGYEAERCLFQIGRTYELAGRTDEALAAYEDLQKRFPDTVLVDDVSSALSRLRSNG